MRPELECYRQTSSAVIEVVTVFLLSSAI